MAMTLRHARQAAGQHAQAGSDLQHRVLGQSPACLSPVGHPVVYQEVLPRSWPARRPARGMAAISEGFIARRICAFWLGSERSSMRLAMSFWGCFTVVTRLICRRSRGRALLRSSTMAHMVFPRPGMSSSMWNRVGTAWASLKNLTKRSASSRCPAVCTALGLGRVSSYPMRLFTWRSGQLLWLY